MARGVRGHVRVVQVGNLVVPVDGHCAARIGTRHEWRIARHFNLGLEHIGPHRVVGTLGIVGTPGLRAPAVDQEHRHRPCACRKPGEPLRFDGPHDDVQPQPARPRHRMVGNRRRQRHSHRSLLRMPPPHFDGLAVGTRVLVLAVGAPAHRHCKIVRLARHEEAQADRGREEPTLGG